jgi:hypothetical protein
VAISLQAPTLLFTGWLPTDNWQLNSLTHQSATSRHFTSLHWTADNSNSGTCLVLLITFRHEPFESTVSIVIVQQYLDRCIETGVCLLVYYIGKAVIYSHRLARVYKLQYDNLPRSELRPHMLTGHIITLVVKYVLIWYPMSTSGNLSFTVYEYCQIEYHIHCRKEINGRNVLSVGYSERSVVKMPSRLESKGCLLWNC